MSVAAGARDRRGRATRTVVVVRAASGGERKSSKGAREGVNNAVALTLFLAWCVYAKKVKEATGDAKGVEAKTKTSGESASRVATKQRFKHW
jgi:hypothetical protein